MTQTLSYALAIAMSLVAILVLFGIVRYDPKLRYLNITAWLVVILQVMSMVSCWAFAILGYDIVSSQAADIAFLIRNFMVGVAVVVFLLFLREYHRKKGDEKLSDNTI